MLLARTGFVGLSMLALLAAAGSSSAQARPEPARRDLVYATVDGRDLTLDLYLPRDAQAPPPLLIWVHGGRWMVGSKDEIPATLVTSGFAAASLDFRQSGDARFPAQAHDIKAAIRFLRARAAELGYRPDRFALAGNSSGGHLAALVGVTNGDPELEGTLGDHRDVSSDVQAIVSFYGASNLTTILDQSTPFGLGVREPALEQLLGALPDRAAALARLASPVFHVDATDPPLLLLHGDQDPQMPINQAHELQGAYEAQGLDVGFYVLHGSVHGGPEFYDGPALARVRAFLQRTLGN